MAIYTLKEGIDLEDYVIATFFIGTKPDDDVLKYAESIAFEQTTGTWVKVPEETQDVREKHGGKVIGIYEVPAYEYMIPKATQGRQFAGGAIHGHPQGPASGTRAFLQAIEAVQSGWVWRRLLELMRSCRSLS